MGMTGAEKMRSINEYAFDLLTLGVLWQTYMSQAKAIVPWRGRLLRRLVRARMESERLKPAADRIRARFGADWLAAGDPFPAPAGLPTLKDMDRLLLWLAASGEFVQEAERLSLCRQYLERQPLHTVRSLLQTALTEADWFKSQAAEALGSYTPGVDAYRQQKSSGDQRREDALLRDRHQVEYHLNLFGAELMNRAYRSDYSGTAAKAVLLPVCLKARSGADCAANRAGDPHRCLQCSKECRVSQAVSLGEQEGFEVIMISHESDAFSRSLIDRLIRENTGIVGVACALNLVSGGLRAKAMGIPAQCVILDYCGCGQHWDDGGGFPTDLNLSKLKKIVNQEI
jgi:hypothetical protein